MIRFYLLLLAAGVLFVGGPMSVAHFRSPPDDEPWMVTAVLAGLVLMLVAVLWELRKGPARAESLDPPTMTEE